MIIVLILKPQGNFIALLKHCPQKGTLLLSGVTVLWFPLCGRSREARLKVISQLFVKQLSSMHLTHKLELFPDQKVTQMLFKEVKNAAELRQSAVDGKINAALINPTMVRHFNSSLVTFY